MKHDKGSAHDWAAQKGQEATARMAIAAREGANVQPHNWTPLAWAASAGHKDVVKLLLTTTDVDPDARNLEATRLCH